MKLDRVFKPTGLKIIFALLADTTLLNAPYRKIAEQAGVGLANIGAVLRSLEQQGYIAWQQKKRVLCNCEALLNKWTDAFPALQRKTYIDTFTTDIPLTWEAINIKELGGIWGGEVAAAGYTQFLTPKHGTIYIPKARMRDVMHAIKLRKIKLGEVPDICVELYEPFWTAALAHEGNFAHPIITFAELVTTGNPRNLEAALKIHEKFFG